MIISEEIFLIVKARLYAAKEVSPPTYCIKCGKPAIILLCRDCYDKINGITAKDKILCKMFDDFSTLEIENIEEFEKQYMIRKLSE